VTVTFSPLSEPEGEPGPSVKIGRVGIYYQ
jgi:hypothetical protein